MLLDLLPLLTEQPAEAAAGGGGARRLSVHWPDLRLRPDEMRDDELALALLGAL